MRYDWKPVEVLLPEDLARDEVIDQVNALIRFNAAEAGDFVQRVRIDDAQPHSPGWRRWPAEYLPGPPGTFPTAEPEQVR